MSFSNIRKSLFCRQFLILFPIFATSNLLPVISNVRAARERCDSREEMFRSDSDWDSDFDPDEVLNGIGEKLREELVEAHQELVENCVKPINDAMEWAEKKVDSLTGKDDSSSSDDEEDDIQTYVPLYFPQLSKLENKSLQTRKRNLAVADTGNTYDLLMNETLALELFEKGQKNGVKATLGDTGSFTYNVCHSRPMTDVGKGHDESTKRRRKIYRSCNNVVPEVSIVCRIVVEVLHANPNCKAHHNKPFCPEHLRLVSGCSVSALSFLVVKDEWLLAKVASPILLPLEMVSFLDKRGREAGMVGGGHAQAIGAVRIDELSVQVFGGCAAMRGASDMCPGCGHPLQECVCDSGKQVCIGKIPGRIAGLRGVSAGCPMCGLIAEECTCNTSKFDKVPTAESRGVGCTGSIYSVGTLAAVHRHSRRSRKSKCKVGGAICVCGNSAQDCLCPHVRKWLSGFDFEVVDLSPERFLSTVVQHIEKQDSFGRMLFRSLSRLSIQQKLQLGIVFLWIVQMAGGDLRWVSAVASSIQFTWDLVSTHFMSLSTLWLVMIWFGGRDIDTLAWFIQIMMWFIQIMIWLE